MQTKFDKLSSTIGNLTVEVFESDYNDAVNKKLKEYARTAHVKGFRPGHVPLQYIKSIYGKSVLIDEVIKISSAEVNKVIAENNLNVVGEPLPTSDSYTINWGTDKEFKFIYEVGFASDFKVNLDTLPSVTHYEIEPNEEQVQTSIEDLRKRFAKDLEVEEAEEGDLIFGTLSQVSTEFSNQCGIPTDKVKDDIKNLFKGLEKGSKVTFDIQTLFNTEKELGFATGKSDEEAAQLNGDFDFYVDKISRMQPSDLDQEFFDKVLGPGQATNVDEFNLKVKEIIKGNYSREAEFLLDFEIDDLLIKNHPIELPDDFMKKWLLELNHGKATAEDIDKEYDSIARGTKLDLMKTQIAKEHDVKIEYADVLEEVKEEIRGYFNSYGAMTGLEDFINNMAEKQLKEKKQEEIRKYTDRAFGRKIINFLKGKINKEIKLVKVDEFTQIAEEKFKQ
jgi:trigger factor